MPWLKYSKLKMQCKTLQQLNQISLLSFISFLLSTFGGNPIKEISQKSVLVLTSLTVCKPNLDLSTVLYCYNHNWCNAPQRNLRLN